MGRVDAGDISSGCRTIADRLSRTLDSCRRTNSGYISCFYLSLPIKRGLDDFRHLLRLGSLRGNMPHPQAVLDIFFGLALQFPSMICGKAGVTSHSEVTAHYSGQIAMALGLPPDEIKNIRAASFLHDIGKIGISKDILLKSSKLTKMEFELIKKHPQIGADLIRRIQCLHDTIPLVLYHHERWDGTGYPAGLKGEQIPMGARIIAIAEVYVALTSNLPWRKAYSKKEAMEIIKKGSGTQFDPKVVNALLKILEEEKNQR